MARIVSTRARPRICLRIVVLGDVAAAGRFNMSPTVPLAAALRAAVDLSPSPWDGIQLIAGKDDDSIVLIGAEPLSAWHRNPSHGPGKERHPETEMTVRLVFADGEALELGPFVRGRICERCTYRDVFLFDALNDGRSDGQFDLLDYGRGHRMRRRGRWCLT